MFVVKFLKIVDIILCDNKLQLGKILVNIFNRTLRMESVKEFVSKTQQTQFLRL